MMIEHLFNVLWRNTCSICCGRTLVHPPQKTASDTSCTEDAYGDPMGDCLNYDCCTYYKLRKQAKVITK